MRIRVYPYKQGSRSARAIADGLGGRVLRLEGSTFVPRRGDVIINWGSSAPSGVPFVPTDRGDEIINHPALVGITSNKLQAFQRMKEEGVTVPDFWTRMEDIPDDAFPIVCRTILNGHSGRGIHIANTRRELVQAPLYVRYVKKAAEYRVHVMGKSIIAVQRKARDRSVENPNWQVRNHANGFVFVRNDVHEPASVREEAVKAIEALGLDFGAVDIIWNGREECAYVLEVNTAPGLEGQTVDDYVNGFKEYFRESR